MPVYQLSNDYLAFPSAEEANSDGLLAIGGDLHPDRLLLAYENGIFPWFNAEDPVLWWSPDPRFVLFPEKVKIAKSMRPYLNGNKFTLTVDEHFAQVVNSCSKTARNGQHDTWITGDMLQAYTNLYNLGMAHSVEVWQDNKLAGGLYGVSIGATFFGESMFSTVSNASKFALIKLCEFMQQKGFLMLDCQVYSNHLQTMGAEKIPRKVFLQLLTEANKHETLIGKWNF